MHAAWRTRDIFWSVKCERESLRWQDLRVRELSEPDLSEAWSALPSVPMSSEAAEKSSRGDCGICSLALSLGIIAQCEHQSAHCPWSMVYVIFYIGAHQNCV